MLTLKNIFYGLIAFIVFLVIVYPQHIPYKPVSESVLGIRSTVGSVINPDVELTSTAIYEGAKTAAAEIIKEQGIPAEWTEMTNELSAEDAKALALELLKKVPENQVDRIRIQVCEDVLGVDIEQVCKDQSTSTESAKINE